MLQKYTKSKFCIATVNGTSALRALLLIGVKENDEVLLPTMTFVATANAVIASKGIPHFIDSEDDTLGIDTKKLIILKEISIINFVLIRKLVEQLKQLFLRVVNVMKNG